MMHLLGMVWFFLPLLLLWGIGSAVEQGLSRGARSRRVSARSGRDERATHEVEIFRLAKRLGGRVTVSDVVVATGLAPKEAESMLGSMADGVRVHMEVSDRGGVYYEFSELSADPAPPPEKALPRLSGEA